jgi:hypothetical protein
LCNWAQLPILKYSPRKLRRIRLSALGGNLEPGTARSLERGRMFDMMNEHRRDGYAQLLLW